MLLSELKPNYKAKITKINLSDKSKTRFFNLGIREESNVIVIRMSPFKDLIQLKVNDTFLAIRVVDSKLIEVEVYE